MNPGGCEHQSADSPSDGMDTLTETPPTARQSRDGGPTFRAVTQIASSPFDALRRIPTGALICALVAFVNAACWSLITPPFQVPDEPSHFAYVQHLAQTGSPPPKRSASYSQEEQIALRDLLFNQVRLLPSGHTISSAAAQRRLEHDLTLPLSREDEGVGLSSSQPPLYYALMLIPYYAGSGGTVLDQLALMRLLSAMISAITALFAFLFIRETLPRAPWAWIVGGLGVALAPLLGFMSGGVNSDVLLAAVSATLLYCLARGFRSGLTPKLAIAIGATTAVGLSTKLNFLGLTPGLLLGLLILTIRAAKTSRRNAYRSLGLALVIGAFPVYLYLIAGHPSGSLVASAITATLNGSLLNEISYIWQFYLPRLPGMHNYFPGVLTIRQVWLNNWVGLYGWLDTTFPRWVYNAALIPIVALLALLTRELIVHRSSLRRRVLEPVVYAAMAIGLMATVGAGDYVSFPELAGTFAEPRYFLPLISLYGAALALAARGAGPRWGRVAGTLIVILIVAHNTFSQLLEVSRYYG